MDKVIAFLIVKCIKWIIFNAFVVFTFLLVVYVFKSEVLQLDLIPNFTINPLELVRNL